MGLFRINFDKLKSAPWRSVALEAFETAVALILIAVLVRYFWVAPYLVTQAPSEVLLGLKWPLGVRVPLSQDRWFQQLPEIGDSVVVRVSGRDSVVFALAVVKALPGDVANTDGLVFEDGPASDSKHVFVPPETVLVQELAGQKGAFVLLKDLEAVAWLRLRAADQFVFENVKKIDLKTP